MHKTFESRSYNHGTSLRACCQSRPSNIYMYQCVYIYIFDHESIEINDVSSTRPNANIVNIRDLAIPRYQLQWSIIIDMYTCTLLGLWLSSQYIFCACSVVQNVCNAHACSNGANQLLAQCIRATCDTALGIYNEQHLRRTLTLKFLRVFFRICFSRACCKI